jgi:thiamine-monophosphate kinase
MASDEFSLIERYFRQPSNRAVPTQGLRLGIGDDAAVSRVPAACLLVQTIDTLISGRHFPATAKPEDVAYKVLSVNVSDLVAMGAKPWTFLLALTLPDTDKNFLEGFSKGLFAAANDYSIDLIGGDTCRGDLSITIQANGLVPDGCYLERAGAQPGDHIMVSGSIGLAALGLALEQGRIGMDITAAHTCLNALHRPRARTDLIVLLREFASAAIDVSDGLIADLGHVLQQSGVGARLFLDDLDLHPYFSEHDAHSMALNGGDDYQIVFTVPSRNLEGLLDTVTEQGLDVRAIGEIVDDGYQLITQHKAVDLLAHSEFAGGYNHFVA